MWLSDLHECDWYNRLGLDPCNRVEQMEVLRISDNGLQGTLAAEMSILSSLFELTLSDNMITGTFPEEYKSLSDLDTFVLSFNQFEGTLPAFFFQFPDMVYWDVAYNQFTGPLPNDIPERMPDLQVMMMENNDISGTIPSNLGTLNLRRVHMDGNLLTGTIPTELGAPPRLKQLYLHDNKLTGPVPAQLGNLEVLQELTLHYNNLSGRPPTASSAAQQFDVDDSICNLQFKKKLEKISIDCGAVTCECCTCGDPDAI
jgi:Leucine-rich repeat (LRR) protein